MGAESVIDFAGLDSAAAVTETPAAETTVVETPAAEKSAAETTEVETPAADTAGADKEAKQQYNSDGTPKDKPAADATKVEDLPGTEKTPQEIRKTLKAILDADPTNKAAVKQLHGAFERWEAAKAIYPGGVKEMSAAKEFMDIVGGHEGLESLQNVKAATEASDNQLYEGNSELVKNIVEDLKAKGKLDALGKLAPSFLDAVKEHDNAHYYDVIAPHFLAGLEQCNLPGAIGGILKALDDPDPAKAVAAAKSITLGMDKWYKGLEAENKKVKEAVVSPERMQLEKDRAAFLKQQEDFKTNQTTEFKNSVASVCEKSNNTLLGTELRPFLKMPFFVGYGKENLIPLGNTIKQNLYSALKADSAYQAQMKALWTAKTPDRAKIEEYHKARVQSIAKDIVRDTVQKMYPGYAKGGAAAGRVAAAAVKKDAATKIEAVATAAGKPVYVAQKPGRDQLDMNHVDKHGKPDAIMEMIAGRGFLKGSGKWITWRK